MPRLSIVYIRVALIYLAAGFTLGALLLWNKGLPVHPLVWRLLPAHIEFLLMGWTVQLTLGVAFWILPRFRSSRGDTRPAWLAFWLLNLGICLVCAAPLPGVPTSALLWGRMAEASAAAAFAVHAWPRIKPPGA